ncbi:MAG: uroporphyrinogen-III synthase [Chlamydiales bacterium]|nr:uroporphyrinogen-III synthase [Chlamydiales bacterium]
MKKVLFTGLDPTFFALQDPVLHVPLIDIVPRPIHNVEIQNMYHHLHQFTHIIFTSKSAVRIFFNYLKEMNKSLSDLASIKILSVGKRTSLELKKNHITNIYTAKEEQQEGIVDLLKEMDLTNAYILMPRSAGARPLLIHFLVEHSIRHYFCDLYDTVYVKPTIDIPFSEIGEIVFTSPSTVNAFFSFFKTLPDHLSFKCIGEITRQALHHYLKKK